MPVLRKFTGKLERLTVTSYSDIKRSQSSKIDTFEAMFNPDSVTMRHENLYRKRQSLNSTGRPASFVYSKPNIMELTLVIDGSDIGSAISRFLSTTPGSATHVKKRVNQFGKIAYEMNGKTHQPNFLKVSWGSSIEEFECRLSTYTVKYTNFDRAGNPERAEIDTVFIADQDTAKRKAKSRKSSPDITHKRVVKDGDTLPILSSRIYGSPKFYLEIARINQLDDFRNLKPGQEIFFPPLDQKDGE